MAKISWVIHELLMKYSWYLHEQQICCSCIIGSSWTSSWIIEVHEHNIMHKKFMKFWWIIHGFFMNYSWSFQDFYSWKSVKSVKLFMNSKWPKFHAYFMHNSWNNHETLMKYSWTANICCSWVIHEYSWMFMNLDICYSAIFHE